MPDAVIVQPRAAARAPSRALRAASAVIVAAVLCLALATVPATAASGPALTLGKVVTTNATTAGAKVTVTGRVVLGATSAAALAKAHVALTLRAGRRSERFSARLNRAGRFAAAHTTRLRGAVKLTTRVVVGARPAGTAVTRTVKLAAAKVTVRKTSVAGTNVTVAGTVTLPVDTAATRRQTRVSLTLASASGAHERFTTSINAKRAFNATHATKLTGDLGLTAVVLIGGRQSGVKAVRTVGVGISATAPPSAPGGSAPPSGPRGGGGGDPAPARGTPLTGLFKLDAGTQAASGAISGTYFRMLGGTDGSPLPNGDSTALDKTYTLLRPGSDGGLRTDGFQPAPSPAFDGIDPVSGGPSGNALASRIVQPQKFFNVAFSIVTAAVDSQTGQPDPQPTVLNDNGVLSGQLTAWDAQWNGQSFNQGSPKPDGSFPGNEGSTPRPGISGTIALSGRYDAASGHFVLTWQSLIVGGPFDHYTGLWHLEGTFVPAA